MVPDPLHILLRVHDVLLERFHARLKTELGSAEKANAAVEAAFKPLAPNFKHHQDQNGEWVAASMNGNDRLLLLSEADVKSCTKIKVFGEHVDKTWKGFASLCRNTMNSWEPPTPSECKKSLEGWIRLACSSPKPRKKKKQRGRRRAGTGRVDQHVDGFTSDELITVHMHHMACHIHDFTRSHGSLKPFSMQNLELHNDMDGKSWNRKNSRRRGEELREMLLRNLRLTWSTATNRKTAGKFKCSICGKDFEHEGRLEAHKFKKHGDTTKKMFTCHCGKLCTTKKALRLHNKRKHS